MAFVEQPILPKPRGFVEPNPELFGAVAALARRAYEALGEDGAEPTVSGMWDAGGDEVRLNTRVVAERLERIARAELKSEPIADEDLEFLRTIGGTFEAIFLMQQKGTGQSSGQARQEHGISLVTDIHTNITSKEALTIGIGRLDRIYVAVPDAIGARMTVGAVHSFYETRQPMADRLTDEQWNERIVGGTLPPRPSWVSSFLEDGEGAGPR
jgi:hypothetical protein